MKHLTQQVQRVIFIDTASNANVVKSCNHRRIHAHRYWVFRPSFKNLSRIGSPSEIVSTFGDLYGASYDGMLRECPSAFMPRLLELAHKSVLQAALHILYSCYEGEDDGGLVRLLGGFAPN